MGATDQTPKPSRTLYAVEVVKLQDGSRLASCIDSRGNITFWCLLASACPETGGRAAHVRHEQLGPLPNDYVDKLDLPHCSRLTGVGLLCERTVPRPGDACGEHGTSKPE